MTRADKEEKDAESDAENWEAATLRRVAPRVESLPESPPEADDFGWEEAVLENLRRRLAANE
ncbi:MAG TPA: hypothetical protein VFP48_07645 [Steroidobacteraceae bacterium]|nr:hypothetical protein [Steroidobacteraceae bacterium]